MPSHYETRRNRNCPDGMEHQMPNGRWMCGETHQQSRRYQQGGHTHEHIHRLHQPWSQDHIYTAENIDPHWDTGDHRHHVVNRPGMAITPGLGATLEGYLPGRSGGDWRGMAGRSRHNPPMRRGGSVNNGKMNFNQGRKGRK